MTSSESPIDDIRDMTPGSSAVPFREGIALLWSYARPHLHTLIIGILLGLFTTAITLATPMVTKWVLDSLGAELELARPVAVLVLILIVGIIANLAQSVLLGRISERIVLDARRGLVSRFFLAKLEQIQRFRTGELVTRVTSDTLLLREAATNSLVQLINGLASLVGTIVLMALLDWPLLLTTLLALVVVVGLFGVLVPQIGKADKRAQDAIGELGAALEGDVRALRTVKSSRAEFREIARVNMKAEESARHAICSVWFSALAWAVAGGGMQLAVIVILGLGARRLALGELAVSTLVAFLLYAFNIVEPITSLAGSFATLQSGLAAAARIRETEHLELENTHARPSDAVADPSNPDAPVLALRAVTAGYADADTPALSDVTLAIPRKGHIALVGPSGAGKTTVFSLLLRFIDPSSGRLELNGVPYDRLSIDDVRSGIAYVEQETPVIPGTVRDNVLFRAPGATDDEAWEALASVRLDQKIRSLNGGLDANVTETTLSGGERQRLAVARALVRRPNVLLLDEATAQLDATTEAAIQNVIATASREGAVVTIAHRLSTVLDADQIIVLEDGVLRDIGTHRDLLIRDTLYRELITALRIHTNTDPTPASHEHEAAQSADLFR
ncbi:ABC transporter ATP-binding protein [Propionibacterium australiense]|uniref:AAA+ ATPase domain n=1 Tax=Propionibacterium australiense TaxID=119981 RepID=A0A383S791_9ACTN|nr:ABC transporter ATP-binding protein [Propionibacterium australiense]RLP09684.1 ATP-binding cassette domain-containing protein [Propionibacterium australiense]RLP12385.1 ATP-binding cassette domain-containing protein [Propionibacterium australiense]SYZ33591.1 AAA+ ATPase domain [Propionibacterium australiense]VEH89510.1 Multidrug resistance ABC transporter ATP-binding and permease protein [Propionibacterium australiense]